MEGEIEAGSRPDKHVYDFFTFQVERLGIDGLKEIIFYVLLK